jgi:phosphatidyl-myo-inositol dimannoside synthase
MAPAESKRAVLLVTNDLGPHAGGIESFILGLINELDGSDLVIYTSSEAGSTQFDSELESKTRVRVIRDKSKTLLPTPRVIKSIKKIVKEYQSEIVWFGAAAPLGLMAKKLKQNGISRAVALTHGHEVWWAKVPPFNFAMRKIGNHCDVITYLGPFTRDAIKSSLGKNPELVQIAPGIATSVFRPGRQPRDLAKKFKLSKGRTIICVGRLVKRKGQDQLIKAMPEVLSKVPDAKLIFVGEGPLRGKLEKLSRKLKIEKSIIFFGRIEHSLLPKYFLLGDIFAMPSRSRNFGLEVEGLGIVYLEASASGLPVIGGASGGAPDAVLAGKTGYVVNGGNTREISEKIIDLLNDKTKAKKMGANGRKWTAKNWSWKIWGKKFSQVLYG